MSSFPNLVSTNWLADNLHLPELRILDASWYMPAENRDPFAEFKVQHIAGAQFFDIEEISDHHSDLPHMAPDFEQFVSWVKKLGISDGCKIVIYDGAGVFSAPRVWWLFKLFNFPEVAVLDGGLPKWMSEGREVTNVIHAPFDRDLTLSRRENWNKSVSETAQASKMKTATILDARAPERFEGKVAEPRAGLRSGHIPNAKNLFFKQLLKADGTYKSVDGLKEIFDAKGVSKNDPIITSCGSGVTASVISLALELAGYNNHALYDGSWTEWGGNASLAIETGPEK